jgi:phosphoribosylformylglycinamidine cyclo-ligase
MKRITIHGMAHLTGGGFPDNIPRILPANLDVVIDRRSWTVPAVFRFIQQQGCVDRDEMYRVFNMGIGYVIIVRKNDVTKALQILKAAKCPGKVIGAVKTGHKSVLLEN